MLRRLRDARGRGYAFASASLASLALVVVFAGAATAALGTIDASATATAVSLKNAGKPITSLKQGRYRIVIRDRTRSCGFRLGTSAATLVATGKRFVGSVTRVVVLKPGTYTYTCGTRAPARTLRVR